MYSKAEVQSIKREFWTAFGVIMKPHLSASGFKINWINYKTGVKDILFRLDADNKQATISIQLLHKDEGIRSLYYEQFLEFKTLFHAILEEEWIWEESAFDNHGKEHASIYIATNGNIFDKDQWQEMFAFLKNRLIKLDEFWSDAIDIFKSL